MQSSIVNQRMAADASIQAAAHLQQLLESETNRVKLLESELETEKMKTLGMQMLFDCVQEEHADNRRLKNLLKRQKNIVHKMRRHLETNLKSGTDFINWDELSDPSDFEDSGKREKWHLESSQESKDYSDDRLESLGRSLKAPGESTAELQQRVSQLTEENEQLTKQLRGSGNDKDVEILELRKKLKELEKSSKVSGVLCDTLSDEAAVLKRHLAGTVDMCQKLIRTLEAKPVEFAQLTINKDSSSKASGDDTTVQISQQQYAKLESKLKEVVTMNSRWQQYNEQREEYVQQLLQRNVELEQALTNRKQQLTLAQQEQIDHILIEQKQKLEMAREEKLTCELEAQLLKQRFDQLQTVLSKHNTVIRDLREKINIEAVEHARALRQQVESNEALKVQLQMFREDFESERRDRERAQATIIKLEGQIRSASQQLSLHRMAASSDQSGAFDQHPYHIPQSSPLEASLVGRGHLVSSPEDKIGVGDLDLKPTE